MIAAWAWVGLAGCRRESTELPPAPADPPALTVSVAETTVPKVNFVWLATVASDRPVAVTLTVDDGESTRDIAFPLGEAAQTLPIYALRPAHDYTVTAAVTAAGETTVGEPLAFTTGALPANFPAITVSTSEPARMEPGLTLAPVSAVGDLLGWITAFDAQGRVVYAYGDGGNDLAVTRTDEGTLLSVDGHALTFRWPSGEVERRYLSDPTEPEDVAVGYADFHHDAIPLSDGHLLALTARPLHVDAFPVSYEAPDTFAPAEIVDNVIVELDAAGSTVAEWPISELLDTRRIGWDSLNAERGYELPDWAHANALQYDPATDEITVGLRHQDAVVRFGRGDGEIRWILANPYGWPPELAALRLELAGGQWHMHQHAPYVTADGRVWMFDNGNAQRSTPYGGTGQVDEDYSRLVEYTLDLDARTATETWSFAETASGRLFSGALGNCDELPVTGNLLGTWGSLGDAVTSARVIEVTRAGETVFDLQITGPNAGFKLDRAVRIPTLYPPGVVETWR